MTWHHDIALALGVAMVIACLFGTRCDPANFDKVINLAMAIAIATFAHAQGARSATTTKRSESHDDKEGGK